jgi:hypothetical protein
METHATVSEREWADGVLDDAKLAELIRTFRECGFATIGNVVPAHALDALQRRMDYDAAHQAAALKWEERGPSSGAGGHLQMGVPRMAPFVAKEIVANPIIEQLAVALLGEPEETFLAFFNGNTNIRERNSAAPSSALRLHLASPAHFLLTLLSMQPAAARSCCTPTVAGICGAPRRLPPPASRGPSRRPTSYSTSARRRLARTTARRSSGRQPTWIRNLPTTPSHCGLRATPRSSERRRGARSHHQSSTRCRAAPSPSVTIASGTAAFPTLAIDRAT